MGKESHQLRNINNSKDKYNSSSPLPQFLKSIQSMISSTNELESLSRSLNTGMFFEGPGGVGTPRRPLKPNRRPEKTNQSQPLSNSETRRRAPSWTRKSMTEEDYYRSIYPLLFGAVVAPTDDGMHKKYHFQKSPNIDTYLSYMNKSFGHTYARSIKMLAEQAGIFFKAIPGAPTPKIDGAPPSLKEMPRDALAGGGGFTAQHDQGALAIRRGRIPNPLDPSSQTTSAPKVQNPAAASTKALPGKPDEVAALRQPQNKWQDDDPFIGSGDGSVHSETESNTGGQSISSSPGLKFQDRQSKPNDWHNQQMQALSQTHSKTGSEAIKELARSKGMQEYEDAPGLFRVDPQNDHVTFAGAANGMKMLAEAGILHRFESPNRLTFDNDDHRKEWIDSHGLEHENQANIIRTPDGRVVVKVAHPNDPKQSLMFSWDGDGHWVPVGGVRSNTNKQNPSYLAHEGSPIDNEYTKHISNMLGLYIGSGDKFNDYNTLTPNIANRKVREAIHSGMPDELARHDAANIHPEKFKDLISGHLQSANQYVNREEASGSNATESAPRSDSSESALGGDSSESASQGDSSEIAPEGDSSKDPSGGDQQPGTGTPSQKFDADQLGRDIENKLPDTEERGEVRKLLDAFKDLPERFQGQVQSELQNLIAAKYGQQLGMSPTSQPLEEAQRKFDEALKTAGGLTGSNLRQAYDALKSRWETPTGPSDSSAPSEVSDPIDRGVAALEGADARPSSEQTPPADARPGGEQTPPADARPSGEQTPPADARPSGEQTLPVGAPPEVSDPISRGVAALDGADARPGDGQARPKERPSLEEWVRDSGKWWEKPTDSEPWGVHPAEFEQINPGINPERGAVQAALERARSPEQIRSIIRDLPTELQEYIKYSPEEFGINPDVLIEPSPREPRQREPIRPVTDQQRYDWQQQINEDLARRADQRGDRQRDFDRGVAGVQQKYANARKEMADDVAFLRERFPNWDKLDQNEQFRMISNRFAARGNDTPLNSLWQEFNDPNYGAPPHDEVMGRFYDAMGQLPSSISQDARQFMGRQLDQLMNAGKFDKNNPAHNKWLQDEVVSRMQNGENPEQALRDGPS